MALTAFMSAIVVVTVIVAILRNPEMAAVKWPEMLVAVAALIPFNALWYAVWRLSRKPLA